MAQRKAVLVAHSWLRQVLPSIKSSRRLIALSTRCSTEEDAFRPKHPQAAPYSVVLEGKKKYMWCSCGHSKAQPFCDGSHAKEPVNNRMKPVLVEIPQEGEHGRSLCGCKITGNPPFCDGTHMCIRDGPTGEGDAFGHDYVM